MSSVYTVTSLRSTHCMGTSESQQHSVACKKQTPALWVTVCKACVCIYVYTHECAWVCVRSTFSALLYHSLSYFSETESLTEIGARLAASGPH